MRASLFSSLLFCIYCIMPVAASAADEVNHLVMLLKSEEPELTATTADGSFRLKSVLPGLEHYLSLSHTRYKTPNGIHLRFQTTSGNTHDFGQISLGDLNSPSSEAE
ncbi:hypothetical protein MalM14_53860 [Gimesia chilikensis]|nr:hypothetical protein MalM14_53860 [Gimesia chilikensis]